MHLWTGRPIHLYRRQQCTSPAITLKSTAFTYTMPVTVRLWVEGWAQAACRARAATNSKDAAKERDGMIDQGLGPRIGPRGVRSECKRVGIPCDGRESCRVAPGISRS